jgi:hypothetical protein
VGHVELAALLELFLELDLERIVDEIRAGHVLEDVRVAQVRAQRVHVHAGMPCSRPPAQAIQERVATRQAPP